MTGTTVTFSTEPPSKLRVLSPKVLTPPAAVLEMQRQKQKNTLPTNKVLRFFVIFFGEGF